MIVIKEQKQPLTINTKNAKVVFSRNVEREEHLSKKLTNDEIDWGDDYLELEEFDRSIKKKIIIVEQVLNKWKKATNNDRIMDFECLRAEFPEIEIVADKKNLSIKIPKKLMKHLPPPQSYRASRQVLNQKGKCLPTDKKVKEKRERYARVIKKYFGIRKNVVN